MKGFRDRRVAISYSESRIINGWGGLVAPNFRWSRDREKTGHFRRSYIKEGQDEIREIMAIRCTIPNVSAAVWRKKGLREADLVEALKFQQAGDWYLYAKTLARGKVSYRHAALNYFRVHQASVTGRMRKSDKHYQEVLEMHKWFLKNFRISGEVQEWMRREEERLEGRIKKA